MINQGPGFPTDPTPSLRASFREVVLADVFRRNVWAINVSDNDERWLTERLQDTIGIVNFWQNAPEVTRLRGELSDLMLETNIDEIIDHSEELVTEITQLAKVRHQDLVQ